MSFILLLLTFHAGAQLRDPQFAGPNWLTYSGDNTGQHYRPVSQIHRGNVRRLSVAWVYQTIRLPQRSESIPLVRDGVMYVTIGGEEAVALNARTGRPLWTYNHQAGGTGQPSGEAGPRRGANWNRGFGLSGNRLYWTTSDCMLLSLDSRNGSLLWQSPVREGVPCFGTTAAPIVIKNRVFTGERGGDTGALRGHLDAYDAETGKLAWRFYTVPAPGEPGSKTWPANDSWKAGGAAPWTSGTWDPELDLVYWPTGNPGPSDYDGSNREGDNLYSDSVLALRPSDGKLVWHYQFTPHDVWDWDGNEPPVLADMWYRGTYRKLLLQANRNGWFYVLDRVTGQFLSATPFAQQTWAMHFTAAGRPVLQENVIPTRRGTRVCPDVHGGTNWQPAAFHPETKMLYVMSRDSCGIYYPTGPNIDLEKQQPRQFLRALDVETGDKKWEFEFADKGEISHSGVLATGGGLVFFSSRDGQLIAADAATGKVLWNFNTGGSIRSAPMTYMVGGRQYIGVVTKAAVFAFAMPEPESVSLGKPSAVIPLQATLHHVQGIDVEGDALWVSSVDAKARKGFLSRFELGSGRLVQQVEVQNGNQFHPGGIALDGDSVWVPVAEYRRASTSVVQKRNKRTLALESSFEVPDHIGCIAAGKDRLVGGNWDSRTLYTWSKEGRPMGTRSNYSSTRFQDLKIDNGMLVGSGLRDRERGAIEWLDSGDVIVRRIETGRTDRGVVYTNEGMAIRGNRLYLLPEDDPSRLFVFVQE